ncbi:MAG: choice-of-anchor D domain-containing protein [Candidatus Cloacimonadales bacterium]
MKKIIVAVTLCVLMITGLFAQQLIDGYETPEPDGRATYSLPQTIDFEGTTDIPGQIASKSGNFQLTTNTYGCTGNVLSCSFAFGEGFIQFSPMTNITANSVIQFDYNFVSYMAPNPALPLNPGPYYFRAGASTNNGASWTIIDQINNTNHTNSAAMAPHTINIGSYAGQTVVFRFEIKNNGSSLPVFNIDNILFTERLASPVMTLSTPELDFGRVDISEIASQQLFVTNTGSGTLHITGGAITGPDADLFSWSIQPGALLNLTQDQSLAVTMRFAPTTLGAKVATLTISAQGIQSSVDLIGFGYSPGIIMPLTLDFEGTTVIPEEITGTDMIVQVAETHGNTSSILTKSFWGMGPSGYIQFKPVSNITANSIIKFDYRFVGGVPPWPALQFLNSHNYFVAKVSTNDGATWANIAQINSTNHTNSTNMASRIINIGAYAGQAAIFRFDMVYDGTNIQYFDIDNIFFGERLTTPVAEFSHNALDFGTVDLPETALQQVSITNIGGGTLNISSIEISGPNANEFNFSTAQGASMALTQDQSLLITVGLTPLTEETKLATLVVTDGNGNNYSVDLTGFGNDTMNFTLDFEGITEIPEEIAATDMLLYGANDHGNTSAILTRGFASLAPAAYIQFKPVKSITANSMIKFDYRFVEAVPPWPALQFLNSHNYFVAKASTNNGATWATIAQINSTNHTNSVNMASRVINIGAYAGQTVIFRFDMVYDGNIQYFDIDNIFFGERLTTPVAEFSHNPLDFGTVDLTESASQQVTFTNIGGGTLNISSIEISGPNANEFNFSTVQGASMALTQDQSLLITVGFTPLIEETKLATLVVTDANGDNYSVDLTGFGNDTMNFTLDFEGTTEIPEEIAETDMLWQAAGNHGNTSAILTRAFATPAPTAYIQFKPVKNITANSMIKFDYRFVNGVPPWPALQFLNSHNYFVAKASTNNGATWATIAQINSTNHTNSANMASRVINIGAYAGQTVIFRFDMVYDGNIQYFDIDNIFFGERLTTPVANLSHNLLDFATVNVPETASRQISITNIGGGTLNISTIRIESQMISREFSWSTVEGASMALTQDQSLAITAKFAPLTSGNKEANLVITDDLGNRNIVALTGVGYSTTIVMPLTIDFEGTTVIPDEIAGTDMTLQTDHHNSPGNILTRGMGAFGSNSAYVQFKPLSNITTRSLIRFDYKFVAVFEPYPAIPFVENYDYLVAKVSTDNGVTFTTINQINSTNHINSAEMAMHTIDIGAYAAQTAIFRFEIAPNGSEVFYFDLDNIYFGNRPTTPVAHISSNSLDFGTVDVPEIASQQVFVTNIGGGTLNISTVEILGTNANEFSWSTAEGASMALTQEQSLEVTAKFLPLTSGNKEANLVITDALGNSYYVALTGTGYSTTITMPLTLDFEGITDIPEEIVATDMLLYGANDHGNTSSILTRAFAIIAPTAYIQFKPVSNITATSKIKFDYRFVHGVPPWPALQFLNSHNYFVAKASTDNGATWTTIAQINSTNHTNSANMASRVINIGAYAGQTAIFRFEMVYDGTNIQYFDIDNIYFGDVETELTIPTNIAITTTNNGLAISWDLVDNANSYIVYGCDTPDGEYELVDTVAGTSYLYNEADAIKFFKIKASTEYDGNPAKGFGRRN